MVFTRLYGQSRHLRVQLTVRLGERSDPEPDFLLVPTAEARRLLQERRHPTSDDARVRENAVALGFPVLP